MGSLLIDSFAGGLNLRDSPNQLGPHESPSAYNFTLDELGTIKRRNGCANVVALPGVSGTKAYLFYSAALDQWLCARETSGAPNTFKLFSRPGDLSGSWTDRGTINSVVSAVAAFVDFPGNPPKVVICTDVNSGATKGTWTWDGTTLTNVAATVAGSGIALFQDRAYVIGYPTSDANGNPTTMRWCDPKDPATWTATNVQQFRSKDAQPLTGIGLAAGGLIVYKKRSTYRVNDAATGAYGELDLSAGCVNPRAVVALRGRLYSWGADGMYACDGVGALENVGDKLQPYYRDSTTDGATICGGAFNDHVVFAGTIQGIDRVIEYDPGNRWAVLHLIRSAQDKLTSFSSKDGVLYAAAADGDDLLRMFTETAGLDDSVAQDGYWLTPWFLPNSGMLSRLHRARFQGLSTGVGMLTVTVFKDWLTTGGDNFSLDALIAAGSEDQRTADIQALGHGSAFAFAFVVGTSAGGPIKIRALQLIDQSLQWPDPGYPRRQTRDDTGGYRRSDRRGGGGGNTPPPK